ncbi:hypothetical protein SADUNF_Sadunf18G0048600 [Salix dunnii]|uniref:Uncharacterized protein n=1 Tax=Salix dunnii TaxID=1413687 RepID=A0A835MM23_9ROSI|nr:hypothetical protein SADUNF_Sadunf18G0048600 [Salix dunnii]
MTNMLILVMAEALEVLDKFTNVPEHDLQQSPESAMSVSPKAPQTCARTSTRIRTSTVSPRQKMKSKSMEIVEQQEKNNVRKTPATRSSRRMAPAASARGGNTWSAMDLMEKERVRPLKMDGPCWVIEDVETKDESGLGLKEKERVRPLKMDGLCWEIADVETKDESGVDLLTICKKSSSLIQKRWLDRRTFTGGEKGNEQRT